MFKENKFYEFVHRHKMIERFFENHSYKYRDYIIQKVGYYIMCGLKEKR